MRSLSSLLQCKNRWASGSSLSQRRHSLLLVGTMCAMCLFMAMTLCTVCNHRSAMHFSLAGSYRDLQHPCGDEPSTNNSAYQGCFSPARERMCTTLTQGSIQHFLGDIFKCCSLWCLEGQKSSFLLLVGRREEPQRGVRAGEAEGFLQGHALEPS